MNAQNKNTVEFQLLSEQDPAYQAWRLSNRQLGHTALVGQVNRQDIDEQLPMWGEEMLETLEELGLAPGPLAAARERLPSLGIAYTAENHDTSHHGRYQPLSGLLDIKVGSKLPKDYEATTKHEGFHGISAHAPKISNRNPSRVPQLVSNRLGLGFNIRNPKGEFVRRRYAWANEGVIELLTEMDSVDYEPEHPEAKKLMMTVAGHIGFDTLLNACFEPVDPELPASERSPYFKKMVAAYDEKFGQGSMKLIDEYIASRGGVHTGPGALLRTFGEVLEFQPTALAEAIKVKLNRSNKRKLP